MTDAKSTEGHDSCGAQKRDGSGDACRRPAGWGTDHPGVGACKLHGGSTPTVRRGAALVQAARDVEAWGGRLDVSPPEALLELVQTKAAEVAYWNMKVATLSDDERAGLLVAKTDRGFGPQGPVDVETRQAAPHVFLVMLHRTQDQLAQFAAAAIRAGATEELVRLATLQGDAIVDIGLAAIRAARERPTVEPEMLLLELIGHA